MQTMYKANRNFIVKAESLPLVFPYKENLIFFVLIIVTNVPHNIDKRFVPA